MHAIRRFVMWAAAAMVFAAGTTQAVEVGDVVTMPDVQLLDAQAVPITEVVHPALIARVVGQLRLGIRLGEVAGDGQTAKGVWRSPGIEAVRPADGGGRVRAYTPPTVALDIGTPIWLHIDAGRAARVQTS